MVGDVELEVHGRHGQRPGQGAVAATGKAVALGAALLVQLPPAGDGGIGGGYRISLARLLRSGGRIVNLVSSPEIYVNEWASFSTKDFPENRTARCGDKVSIVMLDVEDRRPVEDILWTDEGYLDVYERAGLRPIGVNRPLGSPGEPYPWVSETRTAPWVIYVLAAQG